MSASTRDFTAADAGELDVQDKLAPSGHRFFPIQDPVAIAYLDGNSLGRPLIATRAHLVWTVESDWDARMIRA
jgi:kynureninase